MKKALFVSDSTPYSKLAVKEREIEDFIIGHNDVQRYTELFNGKVRHVQKLLNHRTDQ